MRRVGGNIHEDYSMLTERDIEKRHKIDMMCGQVGKFVNCAPDAKRLIKFCAPKMKLMCAPKLK